MVKRVSRESLTEPYLKVLFYGQAGSTKTRTSSTAVYVPTMAPVLMLEAGGNPISLRDFEKVPDIVHIDALDEFNEPYEWFRLGQPANHPFCKSMGLTPPYRTLIVDSITEVQRMSFRTVIGTTKVGPGTIPATAEIQHFNKVLGQMVTFASLYLSLPLHVILTSLEREDKDESTGTIMYKPLLWGQSAGEVSGYAYLVARLVHRTRLDFKTETLVNQAAKLGITEEPMSDKTVSVALFMPSGKYIAKDQYGTGIPFMPDPTMGKILAAVEKARAKTVVPAG